MPDHTISAQDLIYLRNICINGPLKVGKDSV